MKNETMVAQKWKFEIICGKIKTKKIGKKRKEKEDDDKIVEREREREQ